MQQITTASFVTTMQDDFNTLAQRISEVDPRASQRLKMLSEALVNQSISRSATGPLTTSWPGQTRTAKRCPQTTGFTKWTAPIKE